MMATLLLLAGLALLVLGAELLVRGASRLALTFGLSPVIVGLTVVAFGTSSPELAISVQASLSGQADIAVGNAVGSNITNVLLILGLSALITPMLVDQRLVRLDVPLMIGASVLLWALAADSSISTVNGLLLCGLLMAYLAFMIYQARRQNADSKALSETAELSSKPTWDRHWGVQVLLVLAGLALLVVGSHWLVEGAVTIARALGVSELVISLTLVALGTSLPELATSVLAALRGERDIAVGNIVGSNLFNILGVLGISAAVSPSGLAVAPSVVAFDLPVMVAVALACLPIFFTGHVIARWEGGLFLAYYLAYTAYLILMARQHDALEPLSAVVGTYALPLTAVTLLVLALRCRRSPDCHNRQ